MLVLTALVRTVGLESCMPHLVQHGIRSNTATATATATTTAWRAREGSLKLIAAGLLWSTQNSANHTWPRVAKAVGIDGDSNDRRDSVAVTGGAQGSMNLLRERRRAVGKTVQTERKGADESGSRGEGDRGEMRRGNKSIKILSGGAQGERYHRRKPEADGEDADPYEMNDHGRSGRHALGLDADQVARDVGTLLTDGRSEVRMTFPW